MHILNTTLEASELFYKSLTELYDYNSVILYNCLEKNNGKFEQCKNQKLAAITALKSLSLAHFIFTNAEACANILQTSDAQMDNISECEAALFAFGLTKDTFLEDVQRIQELIAYSVAEL